ncbi:MAG TPA: hypothetical protein VFV84_14895, partial [Burkholderiales bacterium]|nr:hypothetical protein [Burkholderiales bacterium]
FGVQRVLQHLPGAELRGRLLSAGRAVPALKALALWLLILVFAVANGGVREAVLLKAFARDTAFTVSGLLLVACILAIAILSIPWLGRLTYPQYALVGGLWLLLTLAFEFGFGLLVRGGTLDSLLDAYRFKDGNIWPVVLVVVAIAPTIAALVRRPAR